MRRHKGMLLASVVVWVAGVSSLDPACAGTIYVSVIAGPNGDGSDQAPFRDPAKAVEAARQGDTIILRQGTYAVDRMLVLDHPDVTLTTISGEKAVLAGSTTDPDKLPAVLRIAADGVTVADLSIRGGFYGIKPDPAGDSMRGVRLRNLKISDTGADCIKSTNSDAMLIDGCEIGPSGLRQADNAEGIDVIGSKRITIRNCTIRDVATNGIYLKGGTRNGLIEDCRLYNTGHAGILFGQDTDLEFMRDGVKNEAIDCVAKNNLVVNAGTAGIGTYAGKNILFENNTVVNPTLIGQGAIWIVTNGREVPSEQVKFVRNVIVMKGKRPMVFIRNLADVPVFEQNVYSNQDNPPLFRREISDLQREDDWDFARWRAVYRDPQSVVADPMLDPAHDYLPRPSSLAKGLGRQPASRPSLPGR